MSSCLERDCSWEGRCPRVGLGVEGEELGRAFREKPLVLILPSSYGAHGLPRKAGRWGVGRGRVSKTKSFNFLLVPGTGSEVPSREEVRSKHPPQLPFGLQGKGRLQL